MLVHGAWHASIHWNRVAGHLSAAGHPVVALDLPGCGLDARYPASYLRADWAAFETEPSPVRDLGLEDYVRAVVKRIEGLAANFGPVTLVGHSFGGTTITRVGEVAPQLVARLVYLTAFCASTPHANSCVALGSLPEGQGSLVGTVMLGDPGVTGAARINPRQADPGYVDKARQAFYGDVVTDEFVRYAAYLNPDVPGKAVNADARGTAARWGRLPRTYIRCTQDRAIPIELQDRMIREADEFTPDNRFSVQTLQSSHSPFASMPDVLAGMLSALG